MADNEREIIHGNLDLLETDELVKHWLKHDENEWMPIAFEVMEGILIERLGELPSQDYQFDEPAPPAQSKMKSLQELNNLMSDNDPVFYEPNKLGVFIRWINRFLYLLIIFSTFQFILYCWPYFRAIKEVKLTLSFGVDIGLAFVFLAIKILIFFIVLKTITFVLKVLKEMEFNSRKKG